MADTHEVRPDERFDEARLAAYLKGRLPGSVAALSVRQFGGGAANLTYLLDYGEQQYVLRRPPLGPVAQSSHDMGREYKVLSVLHRAFPYAPEAYLYCDDLSVIGAPFFVMERRNGVVVRKTMPPEFLAMPGAARRMSESLIDALADFHAVDFAALGLGDLGKPEGFIERQIEGWYRRWQAAKTEELPDIDTVYGWLRSHVPAAQGVSLVHNDYKLDNVMFAPGEPGRIVAVFDWDMCTLGDPLNDLGALLAYWVEPSDPHSLQAVSMMPVGDLGFLTRDELVERYAARSHRSLEHIGFYHALGLFRVTVIVAQIYVRYVRGQTQDQRFAGLGEMMRVMARMAREACA
jgi:aminoglycoside phosphotransferase (APT) family kinase protein